MEADALTPALLRDLRAHRSCPVVSLSMPTHRREPDRAGDPVRLRNLVAEAGRRLDADPSVSRRERTDIKAQLDRAAAEVDHRRTLDGLTLFAGPQEQDRQQWTLPRWAPERVVLSDSFLTRNLVAAKAQARPYWVLVVAADRVTLWSGSGETLHEHHGDGFPATPEPEPEDAQRKQRVGDTPSTFQDERTRQFLRSADTALAAVLAAAPRPLHLVGLAPALAVLDEADGAARTAEGRLVKGGLVAGPGHELYEELRPVLEDARRRTAERTVERLDDARSRRTFAAGLDEVWEAVRDGRAGLVAVEEQFRRTVRVTGGHLVPVDPAAAPEPSVREDIVDELVETALDGDAEVVFLRDGTLDDHQHVAAELRY